MIRLFTILLICFVPSLLTAQNYAPFKSDVSKRFFEVGNPASDEYFFYADSVHTNGSQTTFHQYYTTQTTDYFEDADCIFWGGGSTMTLDTTWLGNQIVYNSTSRNLELYNDANDVLHFDFSLTFNDSSLLYQDANNKYFIKYIGAQSENVYAVQDSVKKFRVIHYDLLGNVVSSPLHNFEIKLGKNLGLISFFDTYNFPQTETPVQLKGQLNPLVGSYQMTYEELFDWHIGDVLQYRGTYRPANYFDQSVEYRTITITNRVEDVNTVTISFTESSFVSDSLPQGLHNVYNIHYPNPLVIPKNSDLLEKPFNRAWTETHPLAFYDEDSTNFCGTDKYALYMTGGFLQYCDSCRCFGPVDGFGSSYPITRFTKGLGRTYNTEVGYGPIQSLPSYNAELIYYHVNGEQCGAQAFMGINENISEVLTVFPNPTSDILQTSIAFTACTIYDIHGKKVYISNTNTSKIDVSFLRHGMYTLELVIDQQTIRKNFVKN